MQSCEIKKNNSSHKNYQVQLLPAIDLVKKVTTEFNSYKHPKLLSTAKLSKLHETSLS